MVVPAGHGVVGLAVNRRQPVVTPDVRVDARIASTATMRPGQTLCPSVLSLPLVVKGQVVGGFTVGDLLGRVYTDEDLRLAQTFADQAAVTPGVGPGARLPPDARVVTGTPPVRAVLAVPLMVKGQVVGGLGVVDVSGRVFTDEDVRLAQAFADQAAVALENARLYADAERRRVEAETLAGLVRSITATLDPASVLRRVAAAGRELCGSDIAHIFLRDAESDTMFARYGVGHAVGEADAPRITRGRGAGGQAWSSGRPFRTANRPDDPRVRDDYPEATRREGIIAPPVVPIWISRQVEGLLYVSKRAC